MPWKPWNFELSGNKIFKDEIWRNALFEIVCNEEFSEIINVVKLTQSSKAPTSIISTEDGIVNEGNV